MELDQPPNMVNVLVFCDHFMKHVMAYATPDQTAKTVPKFLWQGYILIFRAPVKLLSNGGANFESNIIRELCKFMGIWKVRTSPYHAQTKAFTHIGACLQLNKISHHQIQPALFGVWVLTMLTHQLLFSHDKGHE